MAEDALAQKVEQVTMMPPPAAVKKPAIEQSSLGKEDQEMIQVQDKDAPSQDQQVRKGTAPF